MKIATLKLANGDLLVFDEDHPYQRIAAWVLENQGREDWLRHAREHLERTIEHQEVLRAQERARTDEATAERKAIHEFLREALQPYGPVPWGLATYIDQLFKSMDERQIHHLKRKP